MFDGFMLPTEQFSQDLLTKINEHIFKSMGIPVEFINKENNQIIIDYFCDVWDISFTQVKNRGHYRIRCGTKEARKFLAVVQEYVSQVPCMIHKLNIKL